MMIRFLALAAVMSGLLAGGCASIPENVGRTESHAYTDTHDTRLGKSLEDDLLAHPGQSGFHLLGNGLDAFVARAALAAHAERSLDVQYYLYHDDLTGRLLADQLIKAADRGVRVRVLVDDMGLEGRDESIATTDHHPNIEVRIFNPFSRSGSRFTQFVTRLGSVTRRMHNKSFTADNQITIVGGRNIGDEYFNADPDLEFGDLDVIAAGPVVQEVSESFDLYWNHALAYPITTLTGEPSDNDALEEGRKELDAYVAEHQDSEYLEALRNSKLAHELRNDTFRYEWGTAKAIYDMPEKIAEDRDREDLQLVTELSPYLEGVEKELIIFSAYFVPSWESVRAMKKLCDRGVTVRILTNSLSSTDVSVVHVGYARHRIPLLEAGVELHELNKKLTKKEEESRKGPSSGSKASLHTKSFIMDRERVFIGSFNFDPRSVYENTEIGILLDSETIAAGMAEWFDNNIEQYAFRLALKEVGYGEKYIIWHGVVDGKPVVFTGDPYTSFWDRLGVGLMSFLPVDSQL